MHKLFNTLYSAFFCTALAIVFALADASLIYGGTLPQHMSVAVSITLTGTAVLALVVAMMSEFRVCIAGSQEPIVVITATMVASLNASFLDIPTITEATRLASSTVLIVISTVLLGVFCFLSGYFKLGRFIRYIPYPVIAGFLAGTALLLIKFSLGIAIAQELTLEYIITAMNTGDFFTNGLFVKFILTVCLALCLLLAAKSTSMRNAVPVLLLGSVGLFLLVVFLVSGSIEHWAATDWTLSRSVQETVFPPLRPAQWSDIHWPSVAKQLPQLTILLIIALIAALIKISTLELMFAVDVDEDKELRSIGIANLLTGIAGGLSGFHSLSLTQLARQLRADNRLVGIIVAALCAVTLFFSGDFISYMPRFVFGGMLLWVGLDLLYDSCVVSARSLRLFERFIIGIMMLTTLFIGFMPAVLVGLIAGVILFVIDYSRIDIIRQQYTGSQLRSNVDRGEGNRKLLDQHGKDLLILRLHGYIFFGTAFSLVGQVKQKLQVKDGYKPQYLLLDFEKISDVDSSANRMLERLFTVTQGQEVHVLVSAASKKIAAALKPVNPDTSLSLSLPVQFFDSMDAALEWYENEQLQRHSMGIEPAEELNLGHWFGLAENGETIEQLSVYMKSISLSTGQILFEQGIFTDKLYIVKSGHLDISILADDKRQVRIRKLRAGTLVGEISMYLDTQTTASVRATEASELLYFTRDDLQQMLRERPELAALFHERLAKLLALRLADNIRLIRTLASS